MTLPEALGPLEIDRPFGSNENLYWLLDQAEGLNLVVMAEVEGTVEAGAVAYALSAAQSRHPLLRARIVKIRGRRWFKPAPSPLPPWRAEILPLDGWADEIERRFRVRFDPWQVPLARLTWFKGEKRSVLALTLHHSAADGRSGAALLLEIIRGIGGEREALFRAPHASAPSLDPFHDRSVLEKARARATFWMRRRRDAQRSTAPFPGYSQTTGPHRAIRLRTLRAPHLPTLKVRAREQATTLQGVLGSALLRAIHEQSGDQGVQNLALTSLADLRPSLKGGLSSSDLGLYSATLISVHRLGDAAFWDLAREIGQAIAREVKGGSINLIHEIYPGSLGLSSDRGLGKLVHQLARATPPSAMLTNLGQIPSVGGRGLSVASLAFAVSPPHQNPLSVCVASYGDQMSLTLTYDERMLDGGMATRIGAGLVDQLHAVAPSSQPPLLSSDVE